MTDEVFKVEPATGTAKDADNFQREESIDEIVEQYGDGRPYRDVIRAKVQQ